jgi:hypothetical protein
MYENNRYTENDISKHYLLHSSEIEHLNMNGGGNDLLDRILSNTHSDLLNQSNEIEYEQSERKYERKCIKTNDKEWILEKFYDKNNTCISDYVGSNSNIIECNIDKFTDNNIKNIMDTLIKLNYIIEIDFDKIKEYFLSLIDIIIYLSIKNYKNENDETRKVKIFNNIYLILSFRYLINYIVNYDCKIELNKRLVLYALAIYFNIFIVFIVFKSDKDKLKKDKFNRSILDNFFCLTDSLSYEKHDMNELFNKYHTFFFIHTEIQHFIDTYIVNESTKLIDTKVNFTVDTISPKINKHVEQLHEVFKNRLNESLLGTNPNDKFKPVKSFNEGINHHIVYFIYTLLYASLSHTDSNISHMRGGVFFATAIATLLLSLGGTGTAVYAGRNWWLGKNKVTIMKQFKDQINKLEEQQIKHQNQEASDRTHKECIRNIVTKIQQIIENRKGMINAYDENKNEIMQDLDAVFEQLKLDLSIYQRDLENIEKELSSLDKGKVGSDSKFGEFLRTDSMKSDISVDADKVFSLYSKISTLYDRSYEETFTDVILVKENIKLILASKLELDSSNKCNTVLVHILYNFTNYRKKKTVSDEHIEKEIDSVEPSKKETVSDEHIEKEIDSVEPSKKETDNILKIYPTFTIKDKHSNFNCPMDSFVGIFDSLSLLKHTNLSECNIFLLKCLLNFQADNCDDYLKNMNENISKVMDDIVQTPPIIIFSILSILNFKIIVDSVDNIKIFEPAALWANGSLFVELLKEGLEKDHVHNIHIKIKDNDNLMTLLDMYVNMNPHEFLNSKSELDRYRSKKLHELSGGANIKNKHLTMITQQLYNINSSINNYNYLNNNQIGGSLDDLLKLPELKKYFELIKVDKPKLGEKFKNLIHLLNGMFDLDAPTNMQLQKVLKDSIDTEVKLDEKIRKFEIITRVLTLFPIVFPDTNPMTMNLNTLKKIIPKIIKYIDASKKASNSSISHINELLQLLGVPVGLRVNSII